MAAITIPVIDASAAAPADLVSALTEASCALVIGHDVPSDLRDRAISSALEFFDLDDDEKDLVLWPGDGAWRGYLPIHRGQAEFTGSRRPDPNQKFELPLPWAETTGAIDANFGLWPARPVDMGPTWVALAGHLRRLSAQLLTAIADGLRLPTEDLDAWTDSHFANLVVNDYLAGGQPTDEAPSRLGAHSDRGGITLLSADDAPGGLEIRRPGDEDWRGVVIPPGAWLLQAGDLLHLWTGGTIPANRHRVGYAPAELAHKSRRQSLVYFHYPRLDLVVRPAIDADIPMQELGSGEHLIRRQYAYRDRADEAY